MTFALGSRLIRLLTLDRYAITFNNAFPNAVGPTAVNLALNVGPSAPAPAAVAPVSAPSKVNTLITNVTTVTKVLMAVIIKGDG